MQVFKKWIEVAVFLVAGFWNAGQKAMARSPALPSGLSWETVIHPDLMAYQMAVARWYGSGLEQDPSTRKKAEQKLKAAAVFYRQRPEALSALGRLYSRWGRWTKAAAVLEELERFPSERKKRIRRFMLALALARSGRYHEAARAFAALIKQDDSPAMKAGLLANAAASAMADGRLISAMRWYERAVFLDRGCRLAWYGLAVAAMRDGQRMRAVRYINGLWKLEPDLRSLYRPRIFFLPPADRVFFVATMLSGVGCSSEAAGLWHAYEKMNPENPWRSAVRGFQEYVVSARIRPASASICQGHRSRALRLLSIEAKRPGKKTQGTIRHPS